MTLNNEKTIPFQSALTHPHKPNGPISGKSAKQNTTVPYLTQSLTKPTVAFGDEDNYSIKLCIEQ